MKKVLLFVVFIPVLCLAQEKTKTVEGTSPQGGIHIVFKEPSLSMTAAFEDENGNQALDAGESASLRVTVSNPGEGKAYAVRIQSSLVQQDSHVRLESGVKGMDVLLPGKSAEGVFSITAGEYVGDGRLDVRIQAEEKNGFKPQPIVMTLETRALVPPELAVTDMGIDDDASGTSYGNANGKVEKGETVEVEAIVQNRGQGDALNVKAEVVVGDPNLIFIGRRQFNLGDLAPGDWKKVDFAFTVSTVYSGSDALPFTLKLSEAKGRFGKEETLALTLNQSSRRTTELAAQRVEIQGRQRGEVSIADAPSLTVDVDTDIPRTGLSNPDAVAVVIGNGNYENPDVPSVEFAVRDAAVVKEYLLSVLGYREGNIIAMTDAKKADFERVFGRKGNHRGKLFNYVKPGQSDVFIYYSGHGAPDTDTKQAYFVPVNGEPSYIDLDGYPLDVFYENLARVPAKSATVVIDACFSGGSERGMLIREASPMYIEVSGPRVSPHTMVFTSASGDQVSSWYSEKRHSLFTYYFLKGMRGDADGNGDTRVTAREMDAYLKENVMYMARRLHGREQSPQFAGPSDAVLCRF